MTNDIERKDGGAPDAVLRSVATELEALQTVASGLEDAVAQVVNQAGASGAVADNRRLLQDFDLLTQSLDGLKDYLRVLAVAAEGRPSIRQAEALASLKLGAMRERLGNPDVGTPSKMPENRDDGAVELF